MNSLMPLVIMLCLLLAGCATSNQNETATEEQPAQPRPIRQPDPPKSSVPGPQPKKQINPDTRDYDLTKAAPSSRGQEELTSSSAAGTTATPVLPVVPQAPSTQVTFSAQPESDQTVLIVARIGQMLMADQAPAFLAKNLVIVTNHRQTALQGRVSVHVEVARARDIAGRITPMFIEDRSVRRTGLLINNL